MYSNLYNVQSQFTYIFILCILPKSIGNKNLSFELWASERDYPGQIPSLFRKAGQILISNLK